MNLERNNNENEILVLCVGKGLNKEEKIREITVDARERKIYERELGEYPREFKDRKFSEFYPTLSDFLEKNSNSNKVAVVGDVTVYDVRKAFEEYDCIRVVYCRKT